MDKSERDLLAKRGIYVAAPSGVSDARLKVRENSDDLDPVTSDLSAAMAKARARNELHTAADARGYGGRRTGFKVEAEKQARVEAMERHLLDLARRVIAKDR
jgi:hypothetical protein